jgi:predicted small integral membrane protein
VKIRKKVLWKVPLFCIVTGVIAFNVIVFLVGRFTIVTLPDGTITSDNTRVLIMYGVIFIVALIVGGIGFFRNMTRKEIFFSASIVVAFGLIMNLTQWAFNLTTGPGAVFFMYASQIFEWSSIVPQLLYRVNGNPWLGAFIGSLTPYLFIPFGKKESV